MLKINPKVTEFAEVYIQDTPITISKKCLNWYIFWFWHMSAVIKLQVLITDKNNIFITSNIFLTPTSLLLHINKNLDRIIIVQDNENIVKITIKISLCIVLV